MPLKLGVNIDHIATLRAARKIGVPDPLVAAELCVESGADMIVCHLRQDRRHIQDADLARLRKDVNTYLHLEMACVPEMEKIALQLRPDSVCLVPESPDEITTRGGLNLAGKTGSAVEKMILRLESSGIGVSLFVDPAADSVRLASRLGAGTIELCTRAYGEATGSKKREAELENLQIAAILARELQLHIHAGHGLDYHNVRPVAKMKGVECLNIGFSIMSRAMLVGLKTAVIEMKKAIG